MGAINYGHNDIINIGYDLRNYEEDIDFEWMNDAYEDIENELALMNFEFFDVELKSGYYEGFYFDIKFKYLWLENSLEKKEALKETTRLGNFLRNLVSDYGLVSYNAGWITTYYDKYETLSEIKKAIRDTKKLIKGLYTEKTLTIEKWRELVGIGGNK